MDQNWELGIPFYARALLSQVEERSGHPLVLVEENGIGYDSELRIARSGLLEHVVAYVPEYREFGLHFLVSGAYKILRIWDVPVEERYLPATETNRGLSTEDLTELRRKLYHLCERHLEETISRFLYRGIVRQLTSMPVDIRVEREVASSLPEHHEAQRAYLARQVQDLEPHFSPAIQEVSPERLYRASTAMNVVLADEAAELTGVAPARAILETLYRALGERLREQLHSVREAGYRGDRIVTDLWAKELGMEGWYEWVRWEETE